ncbi:MAG: hypothetical protein KGS61_14690 [Verrucomicrobia bacterium]|nr:hypothetical protein [Verrucomicrobiota bacterium]
MSLADSMKEDLDMLDRSQEFSAVILSLTPDDGLPISDRKRQAAEL